ncbi:hypothetical protein D187_008773 [Cystobacter fuscus DSM 2262]|uniref:Uncharacterized protein n=1 Tax=Cystobacter fuscus (strain ATCC 25194 / DSM 2262 / NBRC 100088 / M29) TaxID=1242864 RepID=S9PE04_CYSF2|nr:hypothetical protein [Cystobacter fuscus]EPX62585.1 hypothetical protein D187_008773 [Cystobacter fuscus DSM 2262]
MSSAALPAPSGAVTVQAPPNKWLVTQRVPVRIAWVNPPRELTPRAGLSAEVTVHTSP